MKTKPPIRAEPGRGKCSKCLRRSQLGTLVPGSTSRVPSYEFGGTQASQHLSVRYCEYPWIFMMHRRFVLWRLPARMRAIGAATTAAAAAATAAGVSGSRPPQATMAPLSYLKVQTHETASHCHRPCRMWLGRTSRRNGWVTAEFGSLCSLHLLKAVLCPQL